MRDITGKKFNRLTAIKKDGYANDGQHIAWVFRCECGKIIRTRADMVVRGTVKSCGCLTKEKSAEACRKRATHGMRGTRIYREWNSMLYRCNPKNKRVRHNYYDRGITVCDEWRMFEPFYEWAISNGYDDKLTLDRIDNNKGYTPDNCRWVDMKTQSRNTRCNVFITYMGETHCMTEWGEIMGISKSTLWLRYKQGDRGDRLFRPVRSHKRKGATV